MKPQSAAARQMIRFSLGIETTDTEVDTAVAAVFGAVARLRR
jgi:cysteine sulfinate desulfinase/cysteine desulfurase-like protein